MTVKNDLGQWLTRVGSAKSTDDVFTILDEFRQLEWTDDDRSKMARYYMKLVERLAKPSTSGKKVEDKGPDGPVWYEKM